MAAGKDKKVIGLITDELGGIMTKFVGLRAKTYSYLIDDSSGVQNYKFENLCKHLNLKIINTV